MVEDFDSLKAEQRASAGPKKSSEEELALSRNISELLERLRLIEERYNSLRREHESLTENNIRHHQELSKQLRRTNENIVGIKQTLKEMGDRVEAMISELNNAAKVHEVKVLERYLDFWDSLQFISRSEAERIIDEVLKKKVYKEGGLNE